jgi:steroid 5-alpha reductase family enzyme
MLLWPCILAVTLAQATPCHSTRLGGQDPATVSLLAAHRHDNSSWNRRRLPKYLNPNGNLPTEVRLRGRRSAGLYGRLRGGADTVMLSTDDPLSSPSSSSSDPTPHPPKFTRRGSPPPTRLSYQAWSQVLLQGTTQSLAVLYSTPPLLSSLLWTLLGTSVVWYLFFYLISVGYALGIALPVAVALFHRPSQTTLHSVLVVIWGFRLAAFLLWREYVAWPAWHVRMQSVAKQQKAQQQGSHALITGLSWILYSLLYFCLALPALVRLQPHCTGKQPTLLFGQRLPVLLQLTGLTLETMADWQKSAVKRIKPNAWCHVGLWSSSTHPNYLGEWIFWCGTLLGGLVVPWTGWSHAIYELAMLVGFGFITSVLQGAVVTLDQAQWHKYGHLTDFAAFTADYGILGPKRATLRRRWQAWRRPHGLLPHAMAESIEVDDLMSHNTPILTPKASLSVDRGNNRTLTVERDLKKSAPATASEDEDDDDEDNEEEDEDEEEDVSSEEL